MIDITQAPLAVNYRELWLPHFINNHATLPSSALTGHPLALTGAQKRTTCDGVHFNRTGNSQIDYGVIHNAQAKLAISLRFKLDRSYYVGAGNYYLFGKWLGVNDYLFLLLQTGTGSILFFHVAGGVTQFSIYSTETDWLAGVWYHVYAATGQSAAGGAPSDGARLRIDNGVAVTDPNAAAIPNGGNFTIASYTPGAGIEGFPGVISDIFVMTDDVTDAEETDLYKGFPPADAVHIWFLDEGRGLTSYDRGTGGNNGTLQSAISCLWSFGSVKQPVMSLDSVNDRAQSTAGVAITPPLTEFLVLKIKSNYTAITVSRLFSVERIDAVNFIQLYYSSGGDALAFYINSNGAIANVRYPVHPSIDDYIIMSFTQTFANLLNCYINGSPIGRVTSYPIIGASATAYLGSSAAPDGFDISKLLFKANIEGVLSDQQHMTYARWLRDIFNLPISI